MKTDCELLRAYAAQGDEAAFAEVVHRHVNLINASALRLLNGNPALAQDVTQTVFTDLARKAAILGNHESVAGWLHTSVRFAASSALRNDQRRRFYEQEASAMNDTMTDDRDACWGQMRPLLDEAVGQLHGPDRDAVLLRYFEDKNHREVGEALGVTENAARMRVERAVDKLRDYFTRHGITASAALLASTLGAKAASAPAPHAFVSALAGQSLLGASATPAGVAGATTKLSAGPLTKIAAVFAASAVLGGLVLLIVAQSRKIPTPPETPKAMASAPTQTTVQAPVASTALANSVPVAAPAPLAAAVAVPVAADLAANTQSPINPEANTTQPNPPPDQNQNNAKPALPPPNQPVSSVGPGVAYYDANGRTWNLVDTSGVLKGKTITMLASGNSHYLALCSDGTLAAWGNNSRGSLGDGTRTDRAVPVLVKTSGAMKGKKVTAIAAAGWGSLALGADGTVYVWGGDAVGSGTVAGTAHDTQRVGQPPFGRTEPALVNSGALQHQKVIAISADGDHALALCADGSLVTWGVDFQGILGPASLTSREPNHQGNPALVEPTIISDQDPLRNKKIICLSVYAPWGNAAFCADGTAYRWAFGTQPRFAVVPAPLPTSLKGKTVVDCSRTLLLYSDGTLATANGDVLNRDPFLQGKLVKAITSNMILFSDGLRVGFDGTKLLPLPALNGVLKDKVVTVVDRSDHVVAFVDATKPEDPEAIRRWTEWAKAVTTTTAKPSVAELPPATPLAAAGVITAKPAVAGTSMATWNVFGAGNIESAYRDAPLSVLTSGVLQGKTISAIAGQGPDYAALCTDGTLVNWENAMDVPDHSHWNVPMLVDTSALQGKPIKQIAVDLALCADGTLYHLGGVTASSIGGKSETVSPRSLQPFSPKALAGKTVTAIAGGQSHWLALCTDGTLAAWGDNGSGQLGNGGAPSPYSGLDRSTLVDSHGALKGKVVVAVAASAIHSMALCSDGSLVQWGLIDLKFAPRGTAWDVVISNVPVPVTDDTHLLKGKTIVAIADASEKTRPFFVALCSDGTLAAWGGLVTLGPQVSGPGLMIPDRTVGSAHYPILVNTSGVLSGKKIAAITGSSDGGGFLILRSDGALVHWFGDGPPVLANMGSAPAVVPTSPSDDMPHRPDQPFPPRAPLLQGKSILAISSGIVLYK